MDRNRPKLIALGESNSISAALNTRWLDPNDRETFTLCGSGEALIQAHHRQCDWIVIGGH